MEYMAIKYENRSYYNELSDIKITKAKKKNIDRRIFSLILIIVVAFSSVMAASLSSPTIVYADASSDANVKNAVSITFKDADLRDILSALALTMNVNIILAEEPVTTSFHISNVTPRTALTYLLKTLGMEYVENGNLIVVGYRETLENGFMNQMSLTRFNLKYITSDVLSSQIDVLGIPVKKIVLDDNNKAIWVQGTPQSISKVKELISMLDVIENYPGDEAEGEVIDVDKVSLTPFKLKYITAETLERLIHDMNINSKTLTIDANPQTIWVDATGQALEDIKELIMKVDVVDNYIAESHLPLELIPYTLNFVTPENVTELMTEMKIDVKAIYFNSNPNKIWIDARSKDINDFEELISKVDLMENGKWPLNVETLRLKNLTASKLKTAAQEIGITAQILTLDSSAYTVWIIGDKSEILDVKLLLSELDRNSVDRVSSFFIHNLENISADEAVKRFELLDIDDAKVIALNYPLFAKEVLVITPSDMKEDIKKILADFDKPGQKIRVPIDFSNHAAGQSRLTARRDLLVSLTGIPASSFHISNNVSKTDTPHYIMWIEETPANITKVKNMISSIDNP